jgi:sulfane dehydrogenase subunit SoxC
MFRKTHPELGDPAAGNGILSRRIFLEGALLVGASGSGLSYGSAEPLTVQPWMKVPGPGFAGYGQPSPFESKVVKVFLPPHARRRRVTDAAAPARGNDHAIRAAFRA